MPVDVIRIARALSAVDNVAPHVNNGPNDGRIGIDGDRKGDDPSANEECKYKYSGGPIIRQIIKTTTGQIAFRNIFADAKERKRGESCRIEPCQ